MVPNIFKWTDCSFNKRPAITPRKSPIRTCCHNFSRNSFMFISFIDCKEFWLTSAVKQIEIPLLNL